MSLYKSIANKVQDNLSEKDEFGRDVELRNAIPRSSPKAVDNIEDYINAIHEKLKGMSWAEYEYELEEINEAEEETNRVINTCISKCKEERTRVCHNTLGNIRASLITMGLYELEDGEVLY